MNNKTDDDKIVQFNLETRPRTMNSKRFEIPHLRETKKLILYFSCQLPLHTVPVLQKRDICYFT